MDNQTTEQALKQAIRDLEYAIPIIAQHNESRAMSISIKLTGMRSALAALQVCAAPQVAGMDQDEVLTDAQIVEVWNQMPGGPDGWLKHFGFIQFARAIESRALSAQAAGTVTLEDLADVVSKALHRAYTLGQRYWQQADSDYASEHKKADETAAKFSQLVDDTRASVLSAAPIAAQPQECVFCDGTGIVRRDEEDPSSEDDCAHCAAHPVQAAQQEELEEALMNILERHTNLSTDAIDERVPKLMEIIKPESQQNAGSAKDKLLARFPTAHAKDVSSNSMPRWVVYLDSTGANLVGSGPTECDAWNSALAFMERGQEAPQQEAGTVTDYGTKQEAAQARVVGIPAGESGRIDDPRNILGDTGHAEADRLIGRLTSADPDFRDCADAAAFIRRLVLEEIKGPDGYATWKDAAIAERIARVSMRPSDEIIDLAREGLTVYGGANMPERTVCAELVRLADAAPAAPSAPSVPDERHSVSLAENIRNIQRMIDAEESLQIKCALQDDLDEARAALASAPAQTVPEGMAIVPIEPTEAMDAAARAECHRMAGVIDPVQHIWDVMIRAAAAPAQQGSKTE